MGMSVEGEVLQDSIATYHDKMVVISSNLWGNLSSFGLKK